MHSVFSSEPRQSRTGRSLCLSMALAVVSVCLAALVFSAASAGASGGTVVGWGYNDYGQAGGGAASSNSCACLESPATVPGLGGATQTSASYYDSLALLSDGTVRAWGYNGYGELGDGSETDSPTPVVVSGLANVVAVASGGYHSLALLSNGTVMSWGYNEYGALGYGSTTGPDTCGSSNCGKIPRPVPGLSNVVAIAASYYGSFALLADGTVESWGYDYYGELGDGVGQQSGCQCVDHPVTIPGLSGVVAIAAGEYSTEALIQDGSVMSWGYNYYGAAGNGTSNPTNECECVPPTRASGISTATGVSPGVYTGAAILADGSARVWGYSEYGVLGNGTTTGPDECVSPGDCAKTPLVVPAVADGATIGSGYESAVVLLRNGTAVGWGQNEYGELGNGSTSESLSPSPVGSGLTGASAISTGEWDSLAIIGPSQTLNVALAGAGTGSVAARGGSCPSICSFHYPQSQVAFLRATPSSGGFAGFSGPCTGTGICQTKLETDQTVTATFGPPKGTTITSAKIKKGKGKQGTKARFSFTAPGAITGYECALTRPAAKHKKRKHGKASKAAGKGSRPKFSACSAPKAFKGLKAAGRYTFRVRALDILGADAKPAVKKFTVRKPKQKKSKRRH